MSELNVRPSCSKCLFKGTNRDSDFTLGDCWHIGNFNQSMDDNIGTTAVFVHSNKGLELINAIQERIRFIEIQTDKAIELDGKKMLSSVNLSPHQSEFFSGFQKSDYSNIEKKWMPDSIKESLITLAKRLFKKSKLFRSILKRARK